MCAGLIPANCQGGIGTFFPKVKCVQSDGVGPEQVSTEQVHLLCTECWRECLLHCRIKMKKVMFILDYFYKQVIFMVRNTCLILNVIFSEVLQVLYLQEMEWDC